MRAHADRHGIDEAMGESDATLSDMFWGALIIGVGYLIWKKWRGYPPRQSPEIRTILVDSGKVIRIWPDIAKRNVVSLDPSVINGLFALGGIIAGAVPTIAMTWLKDRSDRKRHLQDQALQVALEAWRLRSQYAGQIQPLEHQVIFSTLLAELASEDGLTPDRVKSRLAEISAIVDVMAEHSARRMHEK